IFDRSVDRGDLDVVVVRLSIPHDPVDPNLAAWCGDARILGPQILELRARDYAFELRIENLIVQFDESGSVAHSNCPTRSERQVDRITHHRRNSLLLTVCHRLLERSEKHLDFT